MEINFIPHEGVIFQNIGKVCFGQTADEVERILEMPTTRHLSYYDNRFNLLCFYNPEYANNIPSDALLAGNMYYFYADYEIKIYFDTNHNIEYFECSSGHFSDKTRPFIYDKEVFKLLADELIELLTNKNNGDIHIDSPIEMKKSYLFLEIDVSIWRDMNETDARLCIEENKAAGTYEINKEEYEHDLIKSRYFWAIGIGHKGYWKNKGV